MKIILSGYGGHMGKEVISLAEKSNAAEIVCGVDACAPENGICVTSFDKAASDADVIIDFSHHSMTKPLLDFAVKNNIPAVIATTGQNEEEKQLIKEASEKIPVFFAYNYSLGVALLIDLAKKAASVMKDAEIEIVETHHDRKADAPSGTAISIAEGIKEVRPDSEIVCGRSGEGKRRKNDIGISSVRIGNVVGIHEVIVGTANQSVTLKHEAYSRALFAEGALSAACFVADREPGLYSMKDLI